MNSTPHDRPQKERRLQTERLGLRRFEATDADNLCELDGDPEVMRYLTGGAGTPRAVIEDEILPQFMGYHEAAPELGFWAAEHRSSGEFLGWFSMRPTGEGPGVVALGYRLRRAVWGQGYATEGVAALIRLAFTEFGVQRVVATTYEENMASRRVMEKVGMILRRRFRLTPAELAAADTYQADEAVVWDGDELFYALDKSEYAAQ